MKRSQTATEYLIIIAVVIIIAVLVVNILSELPALGADSSDRTGRAQLALQKISVANYGISDYDTVFTLQNKHTREIEIDSITINGVECTFFYNQNPKLDAGEYEKVFCDDVVELDDSEVSWPIVINWTDVNTGGKFSQSGDDLRLVGQVGSKYLATLEANDYWNGVDGCWDQTVNPVPICTCVDLSKIDDNDTVRDLNYTLKNSIDFVRCDETFGTTYMTSPGWIPLAKSGAFFSGIFNGEQNTISHLFINDSSDYVGLFGATAGKSQIINLGLSNVDITSSGLSQYVGALAGYSDSTFSNIFVTGTVESSDNYIGGVIGWLTGDLVESYADVNVTGVSYVGGLVGVLYTTASISTSYAEGNVTGVDHSGGLTGYAGESGSIVNSYASVFVTSPGRAGGLVGRTFGSGVGTITNSYWINFTTDDADTCVGDWAAGSGCTARDP